MSTPAIPLSGALPAAAAPAESAFIPPYAPSFVDRITGRIDRLPGHGWWFYPALLGASMAYAHVLLWSIGRLPWGTFEPTSLIYLVYGPFGLAVIHYLDRVGRRSIREFRPALELPDAEVEALAYQLTALPARWVWPWVVVGAALAIAVLAGASPAVIDAWGGYPAVAVTLAPFVLFGYTGFALVIYHTVRQLRLVSRIHQLATNIDLFADGPLYAFSRLTMRTGVAFILIGYYSMTTNGAFIEGNVAAIGTMAANFVVAIVCFFLPLLGIHGRLVAEKAGLTEEANRRLKVTMAELYRRIDAGERAGIKDVNDSLAGVVAARDLVNRLPTWPWPPQVLRGFVTALVLPILVFIMTRQLGQLLGT